VEDRDPPPRVGLRLLPRHGGNRWQGRCQGRIRNFSGLASPDRRHLLSSPACAPRTAAFEGISGPRPRPHGRPSSGMGRMSPMSPMSEPALSRRAVLLGLGSLLLGLAIPARRAAASLPARRTVDYRVDISMLFALLSYSVGGTMVEEVDAGAGRYQVLITGTGAGVTTRVEARGLVDNGRYRPLR